MFVFLRALSITSQSACASAGTRHGESRPAPTTGSPDSFLAIDAAALHYILPR